MEGRRLERFRYRVLVDDNFHYMDEEERYALGEFASYEEAEEACRRIVDEFLLGAYEPGMEAKALYGLYTMFGDDPFISSADRARTFSAWDYARKRCEEICGDEPC
jgi:hypothetical protein